MKISVSAPGKIHLMGEHAVVYGNPAILSAVNLRLAATITDPVAGGLEVHAPDGEEYVRHAVDIACRELRVNGVPDMRITVRSAVPTGYHLGSSAATAVATVGAVMYAVKKIWNPVEINRIAYEVEKKMHGNPSGGDNTACTFGGFIWFRKELEFLRSIWQLPFRPHTTVNHFFLINTGYPKENTGMMVALVRKNLEKHPARIQKALHMNEAQTKRIATALKEGAEDILVDALRVGEKTLETMGVVSTFVQPAIRSIEKAGGAAKILGGGGKTRGTGYLLCYHHDPERIAGLMKPFNFTLQYITLGEEGVRLEEK